MLRLYGRSLQLFKYKWTNMCCISTSYISNCNNSPKTPLEASLQNFVPIYKLPSIHQIGLLNRMKLYHSVATALLIPTTFTLNALDFINFDMFLLTCAIGITGTTVLFTAGFLTNKVVGVIYLNEKHNRLRIAYIDFWGRRQDTELSKTDIIPIFGGKLSLKERMMYKLKRYSTNETYILNLTYCEVIEKGLFKSVFGVEI